MAVLLPSVTHIMACNLVDRKVGVMAPFSIHLGALVRGTGEVSAARAATASAWRVAGHRLAPHLPPACSGSCQSRGEEVLCRCLLRGEEGGSNGG